MKFKCEHCRHVFEADGASGHSVDKTGMIITPLIICPKCHQVSKYWDALEAAKEGE